ncbi:MAG: hypothetical protein ACR2RL_04140, partial [Gammaproteobacteria bacterium]
PPPPPPDRQWSLVGSEMCNTRASSPWAAAVPDSAMQIKAPRAKRQIPARYDFEASKAVLSC